MQEGGLGGERCDVACMRLLVWRTCYHYSQVLIVVLGIKTGLGCWQGCYLRCCYREEGIELAPVDEECAISSIIILSLVVLRIKSRLGCWQGY